MKFHYVLLRTFAHSTEEISRVEDAFYFVCCGDAETNDDAFEVTKIPIEGHFGNPTTMIEAKFTRSREMRNVMDRLFSDEELGSRLCRELESRVDEDGILYMRFDKQDAFNHRLTLSGGEDVVQVRIKAATYPASRDAAISGFSELLGCSHAID